MFETSTVKFFLLCLFHFLFQVRDKFQSARLTGLDSRDGVLLLGVTHFYVIEGVTLLNSGGLIDIESAPEE